VIIIIESRLGGHYFLVAALGYSPLTYIAPIDSGRNKVAESQSRQYSFKRYIASVCLLRTCCRRQGGFHYPVDPLYDTSGLILGFLGTAHSTAAENLPKSPNSRGFGSLDQSLSQSP